MSRWESHNKITRMSRRNPHGFTLQDAYRELFPELDGEPHDPIAAHLTRTIIDDLLRWGRIESQGGSRYTIKETT